jgi:hypothetical protein
VQRRLTRRIWAEALLGCVSALALAMTLVWPDWIERLFDESPDGGDGSAEWGLALGLAVSTLVAFGAAWRDRQALQRSRAPAKPAAELPHP